MYVSGKIVCGSVFKDNPRWISKFLSLIIFSFTIGQLRRSSSFLQNPKNARCNLKRTSPADNEH